MGNKDSRLIPRQQSRRHHPARSDRVSLALMARLRSIGPSAAIAEAPLGEQEELARKLRAGEIDLNGYYDATVELGLAHLRNRMTPEQLEVVRERMREEVETNPILVKMVRDAVGELAEPGTR